MSDLLDLMVKIGGSVDEDELRYQCRRRGVSLDELDRLVARGKVEREDGWVRATDQVVAPGPTVRRRRRRQASPEQLRVRRERIAELWLAGWKVNGIADELRITVQRVNGDVAKMRAAGIDLPYRHVKARGSAPTSTLELR